MIQKASLLLGEETFSPDSFPMGGVVRESFHL
jgi:hypothetical protein